MFLGHIWLGFPLFAWIIARPFTSKQNCYFWAYEKWLKEGGALIATKSRVGWWVHTMWMDPEGAIWEYVPKEGARKRALPPALFHGKARKFGTVTKERKRK